MNRKIPIEVRPVYVLSIVRYATIGVLTNSNMGLYTVFFKDADQTVVLGSVPIG